MNIYALLLHIWLGLKVNKAEISCNSRNAR